MKHYHRTVISAAVVALMAGAALPAQATPSVGTANTKTATLDFSNPSGVTHTLVAATGLSTHMAQYANFATGTITPTDNASHRLALRFTPDLPAQVVDSTNNDATISGTNTATNKLHAHLSAASMSWDTSVKYWVTTESVANETYYVKKADASSVEIPADTYVVSIDAAIYTA